MDNKNKLVLEEKKENDVEKVTQNLNEHLQENIELLQKPGISFKTILTYIAMGLIIIGCIIIIYVFLDKNDANPFKKETTTTTYGAVTVEPTKEYYSQANTVIHTTAPTNTAKLIEKSTANKTDTTTRTTFHTMERN